MTEVQIRQMNVEDIPIIRKLWLNVGFELSYSDKPEEVKRMIQHNPDLCLVMMKNGQIVASLLGGFDGRRGWIHHLAVRPEFQKKKYGTILMHDITRRFKEMKVGKIKVEILETNINVIKFYKSLGWTLRKDLSTMSLTLFQ